MAANPNHHWEVVSTKGKKKPISKTQKKTFIEKMPRIEQNAPLDPDETIYSKAFLEKESQNHNHSNASGSLRPASNGVAKKAPTQKKKKSDQDGKKVEKPLPADQAIAQIDHSELENILKQSQIRFPDNQDVWLKDLASFLNVKLENVSDVDVIFKGKPQGYPFNMLHKNCQKILNSVVTKFSNQTLDQIYYHSIQAMLFEASKDQGVLGYKIFLQFLAQHKPDIALGKVHQYLELLKTHQNRPTNCLSILWAVGQCGLKNFKCGLKVWLDLMLPALEVRQVAHYPVEYIEMLTRNHKNVSNAYGIVTLREYFQVMDVVFSPTFNLSAELKKRLIALYPNIRDIAYGDTPAQNLRTFFPSYLARLNTATNKDLKLQLLKCLVGCLSVDQQSYSVWCQLYTKHLNASGLLLDYMNSHWGKLSASVNKKLLRETVRSFSVTNDEMGSPAKANRDCLALCRQATKELEAKMTHSGFPWGLLIFFVLSVFGSIVMYDIMSNPELRASRTMRFLEHYGILAVMDQAWTRIHTYHAISIKWLRLNCPVYYSYVCDTVGPWMAAAWLSLKDLCVQAEVVSRPHRVWVGDKITELYHQIYEMSPDSWQWCKASAWSGCELLRDYTLWIWKHAVHLAEEIQLWLVQNVFQGSLSRDSLKSAVDWTVSQGQLYLSTAWGWCDQNIFSKFQ